MGVMILTGLVPITSSGSTSIQVPVASVLPEIEAGVFQGVTLTPISQQGNNAIEGTQVIDRDSYRLVITGLVERNITLTYSDLLTRPAYSSVVYMPCVEGWGFYAKWTGFRVSDLLDAAGVTKGGDYIVFYCSDGYSTGLPLNYLIDKHTLLAYGLNDMTLPADRGFPLQLVAESKYGYKWAKWIVRIEVVKGEVKGYWESRGYSNSGDEGSFPFG
jgi:DMSO/TMAO reductase YedYZ molybdopterin-dependent catalytic subunit